MYLKMNGAYLTKPKVPGGQVPSLLGFSLQTDGSSTQTNSSDASSSDTNGWTFFLHDKKTNPSLAIYSNGDSVNPTSSVDASISSQQVGIRYRSKNFVIMSIVLKFIADIHTSP